MIKIVLKAPGTFQYEWERVSGGWDEMVAALAEMATYEGDGSSLYVWPDFSGGTNIFVSCRVGPNDFEIPAQFLANAASITIEVEGEDRVQTFTGLKIEFFKDSYAEWAKITLQYR